MSCRILLVTLAATVLANRPAPGAETPKHRKLTGVPFNQVRLQDGFWSPRLKTNREKSLPHNLKWCEETGRISNFSKAAGLMPGKFQGIYFNDSDLYKVLEGASYALADHPDPALEKTVDDVIGKIAAAQQPDGYLNTYFTLVEPKNRWTDFAAKHELYCIGHMFEAAVAHYRATGKTTFLNVALKVADHLDRIFGPGKRHEVCGHEEVELALVKLYEATGQQRYFDLAKFFIDMRGNREARERTFGTYCQDHQPVRQQREIVGHAVRAMYLYSGMADVAAHTGDVGLIQAMDALWDDVVQHKVYITGGAGARHAGEAFGDAYELPNDSAYCETCANIGLALWNHRLNLMQADGKYADVVERALYNGVLSGIDLGGEKFFYVNPLASSGGHHRQPFYDCACCPTNVVRFIPSVPGYVYAQREDALYVNLYATGTAKLTLAGQPVAVSQRTEYPWGETVEISLALGRPAEFEVNLRIPGWCEGATLAVAGKPARIDPVKGYARLRRSWKSGDTILLRLPMPVQRMEAHPLVKADLGRVAIQRGPIVYCLEAADNGGPVRNLALARDPQFIVHPRGDLLRGVNVIQARTRDGHTIAAVPYYAWDHRAPGEMAVWIRQDGKSRKEEKAGPDWQGKLYRRLDAARLGPSEPPSLAEQITARASFCDRFGGSVGALHDETEPKNSCDHDIPRFTWYDRLGTKEWVEYEFPKQTVSAVAVYWFDDEPQKRHCRVPEAWQLFYREGSQWKPVEANGPFATAKDRYNRVPFMPVQTTGLRIEAQLKRSWSSGILEWKVE